MPRAHLRPRRRHHLRFPLPRCRPSPGKRSSDGCFDSRISASCAIPTRPPPVILRAATKTEPPIVAPPQPSDLIRLLGDSEARVRRRAALALGRVGLPAAVEPLTRVLADEEFEVRQMAAFALGLLADPSARPALLKALDDPEPTVQGRAAEALGSIGDRADADAIGAMVRRHVGAGVLANIESDDLTYPLDAAGRGRPPRGLCADTAAGVRRPGRFDSRSPGTTGIAVVAVGLRAAAGGRRTGGSGPADAARYARPLHRVVRDQGPRGHEGNAGGERAAGDRRRAQRDPAIVTQALRALTTLGDQGSVPLLIKMVTDRAITGPLQTRGDDRPHRAHRSAAASISCSTSSRTLFLACAEVRSRRSRDSSRRRSSQCWRDWMQTPIGPCASRWRRRSARCRPSRVSRA